MDYWHECVAEACEDAGVEVTPAQVVIIASWIEGAHENYGMAHGHDCIPNPLVDENKRLAQELKTEKDKRICPECGGRGWIVTQQNTCWKCRGAGRI